MSVTRISAAIFTRTSSRIPKTSVFRTLESSILGHADSIYCGQPRRGFFRTLIRETFHKVPSVDDEQERAVTIDREHFQNAYLGKPPWDIGRPQFAIQAIAGKVVGSVLDAGCGTGEHALFFAARGHEVTGIDFLEEAVASAERKAAQRGLSATFFLKDALTLQDWLARFDNVIDSGLFHVFSDKDRALYVHGLKTVLNRGGHLFLLCFSDETPGTDGPRRVSQGDLREVFSEGWKIESIEPARLEVRPEPRQERFSGEDPRGWLLIAQRIA